MDTPICPTCGKPMEPNPPRDNGDGTFGAAGDPSFVCTTDDKAHADARKTRAAECRRLLAEAAAIRAAQLTKRPDALAIGIKEAAASAGKEK